MLSATNDYDFFDQTREKGNSSTKPKVLKEKSKLNCCFIQDWQCCSRHFYKANALFLASALTPSTASIY